MARQGGCQTDMAEPEADRPRGIAVIAHPDPLYGGTMDNKVVSNTLFKLCLS